MLINSLILPPASTMYITLKIYAMLIVKFYLIYYVFFSITTHPCNHLWLPPGLEWNLGVQCH